MNWYKQAQFWKIKIGNINWWNEPTDNAFAKGMTKGEVIMDWLQRHQVPQEGDKYVFYHASPKKGGITNFLRAGSYLAEDVETAVQQATRDRGLKSGEMNIIKVLVNPEELQTGIWAQLRNDYYLHETSFIE